MQQGVDLCCDGKFMEVVLSYKHRKILCLLLISLVTRYAYLRFDAAIVYQYEKQISIVSNPSPDLVSDICGANAQTLSELNLLQSEQNAELN